MNLEQIVDNDKELKVITSPGSSISFQGMSTFTRPKPNSVYFVTSKKILKTVDWESGKDSFSSSAVLLQTEFSNAEIENYFPIILRTTSFESSLSKLSKLFHDKKFGNLNDFVDGRQMGSAQIHPSAQIAQNVFIGEGVRIGKNVKIYSHTSVMSYSTVDEETILYPQVSVYPFSYIGKRCRIHSSSVIGADGFGYNFSNGVHHKIWHLGDTIIEDDVEINTVSNVHRGMIDSTIIGSGSKFDTHVHIGHNNIVGKGVIICGQSGLSGSCEIGDFTVSGGKVGVAPGVKLGKGCQLAGGALVNSDWPDGTVLAGHLARPMKEWLKGVAYLRKMSLKKD